MRIWTLSATAIVLGTLSSSPIARAETKPAQPNKIAAAEAKLIEVRVCPMSGTAVQGDGAGTRTVKNYKVYFC